MSSVPRGRMFFLSLVWAVAGCRWRRLGDAQGVRGEADRLNCGGGKVIRVGRRWR